MQHLLAKVKQKRLPLKLLSDDLIYSIPDNLNDSVVYSPSTLLDENQWYKIEEFSRKPYYLEYLTGSFSSTSYNQISDSDYLKIDYIFSVQNNFFLFQKINSHSLLKKKWFSISRPTIVENDPVILINDIPDAIYDQNNDILYFKKIPLIKLIFKGIEVIFREATDTETATFLSSPFLELDNNFTVASVKIPNRKKIAMVIDTLSLMNDTQKNSIFSYINTYCNDVPFENGVFTISNEESLKKVLFGIEQRYYTTQHGSEKRLANSIIALS